MSKVEIKSILQSKTFYFGTLSILLALANYFGYGDYQPDTRVNEILELLNGIGIILLRVKTNTGVRV